MAVAAVVAEEAEVVSRAAEAVFRAVAVEVAAADVPVLDSKPDESQAPPSKGRRLHSKQVGLISASF